jgi:hypothetical protein
VAGYLLTPIFCVDFDVGHHSVLQVFKLNLAEEQVDILSSVLGNK